MDEEALKNDLCARYGGRAAYLYETGRSALSAAIAAFVPDGGEVIVPGLTCIAVVRAVRAADCRECYVDISRKTLQYDFDDLERKLKQHPRAKAIIVQNTLGITIDMERLEKIAQQHKLTIIEDLAHSAGRFYPDGREVGSVGAATALSFGKGKAIDTISGGALVLRQPPAKAVAAPETTPRPAVRWRARWYPVLGWIMRASWHVRLNKIFTGIFLKLKWIERSADAELDLKVKLCPWQAKLAREQLKSLSRTPLREHELLVGRAQFLAAAREKGYILDEIWYDAPVSPARYAAEADFPEKDCPETVKVASEIINLPTWYSEDKLAPVRALVRQYREAGGNDE